MGAVVVVLVVVVAAGLVAGLVAAGACGVGAPVVVTGAGARDVGAAGPAPPSSGPITTTATTARSGEVLITVRSPVPIVVDAAFECRAGDIDRSFGHHDERGDVGVEHQRVVDVEHVAHEVDVAGALTGREGERGIAGTGDDRVAGAVAAERRHGSQRCGLVAAPEERLALGEASDRPGRPAHHDSVGTIGHDERRRAGVDRYVGLAHRVRDQLPVHRSAVEGDDALGDHLGVPGGRRCRLGRRTDRLVDEQHDGERRRGSGGGAGVHDAGT